MGHVTGSHPSGIKSPQSRTKKLRPWDPFGGYLAANGGRRPTNWGVEGGAPRNFTYLKLFWPILAAVPLASLIVVDVVVVVVFVVVELYVDVAARSSASFQTQ